MSASLSLSPVLSPSLSPIWSGMLCPPPWSCLSLVSGLVSQLLSLFCLVACLSSGMLCLPPLGLSFSCLWSCLWDAVSASLALSFSCLRPCLRPCLPSWLGCCVRLAGLSPVLSPSLSPIWSGMLCPPRWSCPSLVCGLVSHLGWDAVSASLGCLRSCLAACLPSGLGCSVRLPGLVFLLSLVLSPSFCLCFVSLLVFHLGCCVCPPWACLFLVSGLVSQLVWDAVFAFLARLPAQLVSGLLSHPVFQLVWCVRALGLSPKFHVRFVQLFGVYGGVICMRKGWLFMFHLCRIELNEASTLDVFFLCCSESTS